MKVIEPKKWKVNGDVRWVFDGKINGKRKREQFNTKEACKLFIRAQTKEPLIAAWWSELTVSERVDIHASHNRAKEDGFSLLSAVETHSVHARGKDVPQKDDPQDEELAANVGLEKPSESVD